MLREKIAWLDSVCKVVKVVKVDVPICL